MNAELGGTSVNHVEEQGSTSTKRIDIGTTTLYDTRKAQVNIFDKLKKKF